MLIPIKLADGKSEVPKSIQLLKVGSFVQENGKPLQITPALLGAFKKNFDAKVRGYEDGKLPIDYFHENEKVAGGWIEGVTLSDDGQALFAEVKWTPKAEQMLADGELRYVSAEFHPNYRHNEGGKTFGPTLFGAGLTNRPFIKGMQADVNLSEGEYEMTLEEALAKIKELEAKLAAKDAPMMAEKAKLEEQLGAVKKELSELKTESEKAIKLAEKTNAFTKMLAEGKACEAQRAPFLADDMVKFAEAAIPLNSSARGKESGANGGNGGEDKTAVSEVEKLAEKIRTDRKVGYRESISIALSENSELSKKYDEETSIA